MKIKVEGLKNLIDNSHPVVDKGIIPRSLEG